MVIVIDWAFSNVWFGSGAASLQLPMFSKCDALPKGDLFDMIRRVCFRSPFLPFFGEMPSIHSRPEARSLRGTVCSTNSAICLHHAHPFVAASEKSTCLMQRSKAFGHAIVVSKMFWNIVIVLSVVLWDCCKPTNTCRDWAFSNSGLEVGLPAFQLPMFAKCDALPKGDLLDMFVSGVHSCHSFGKCQASNPYQKLELPESRSTLHQLCICGLHHALHCRSCRKKPVLCREARLPAFHLSYVPKMWRTAERRLIRHVCLRNPWFLWNLSLHSLFKLVSSESLWPGLQFSTCVP